MTERTPAAGSGSEELRHQMHGGHHDMEFRRDAGPTEGAGGGLVPAARAAWWHPRLVNLRLSAHDVGGAISCLRAMNQDSRPPAAA